MKKSIIIFYISIISITASAQDTLLFNAANIPYTDTTLVFIPDNYHKQTSCPLLFMLNGYSGNYHQWNDITDLQKAANQYSFVIVCPDGFYRSWYLDSPVDSTMQFEKFFYHDLIPEIFEKYNIDKNNIFITGLSMGGHGAIYLFLKNPGFFKSAGSTSGGLDILPFPESWEIKKVLGDESKNINNWKSHSDIYLINNIKDQNRSIIVDCGTEDFFFDVNKKFDEECRKNGVNITFITGPGNHSYEYWSKSILKHFEFFHKISEEK